ncbi:MAG: cbb3-type cytochrome oxidase assembly protein CcoS [Bryobacterales bacterium]|nr:cbb3-type cytochrome oxidase assembly protein CcoS [Bryobacterales bacterium]
MLVVYVVIWSSAVLLGLSAVWGLVWAIRTGQFHGLREGAESIFDDGEPVGTPTDFFPGASRSAASASGAKAGAMEEKWRR